MVERSKNIEYIAGDKRAEGYSYPDYVIDMDIKEIPFPDNSFDFVLCSHVLEHIIDDRKAMREIRRILKPSGFAIIQVPMDTDFDITDEEKEDENLTPEQRQARFGQFDHVRIYGKDYFARMRDAELPITLLKMAEEDCRTYDLFSWEEIMVVNPPEHLLKCFSCSNP